MNCVQKALCSDIVLRVAVQQKVELLGGGSLSHTSDDHMRKTPNQ